MVSVGGEVQQRKYGSLNLHSKCIRIAACSDAAADPSGTLALSSLDKNKTALGPNSLQISWKSSMKDFANIQSIFFFRRLFSGQRRFTGTV